MTLQDWRTTGKRLSWREFSIFYQDSATQDSIASTKPVLLMVHGFPTSSVDFQPVWSPLAAHYRLLAFDMLGYGCSDKPADWQYSIFQQADIAEALMASLGLRQATLLTHDVGDTVGQELLARHNEGRLSFEIRQLVLLNGGLFPETHRPLLIQRLLLSPLGPLLSRFTSKGKFRESLRNVCSPALKEQDIDDAWEQMTFNGGNRRFHQLIRYMQERRDNRSRWVSALQQAKCPLAVVDGVEDPISGGHMVDRFEELVPGHPTVRLVGLGHYPHLENPARFLEAVLSVLR
ncbi:alpha/beta hydrolase [Limnobacter humi]|uniref:Alpha/beta hydrolase n=1 Tax=Limnobacter humi TaxID=1778671 RepID=A0ABT1WHP5_9BURK|nr:alpha/beta hydrolase [Limnobacter humi]MCQ8897048.1 alpha/beta hydrolase [Limnobacter humi]